MAQSIRSSADVVIVGAGIAAGMIARKLAQQGIDVLMVEAGDRIERWRIVENFRNSAFKGDFAQPYPMSEHAPHPQYSPADNEYLIQKGPDKYPVSYLRMVGGTSWHWAAAAWRLLPSDFRLKTLHDKGRDWPISYDELEPYYQEAEVDWGVAGPDYDIGSPRSQPYPLPQVPLSYFDQSIKTVVDANGYLSVAEPVARNSQPYENRPTCCGNGCCMPICPIDAQYHGGIAIQKAEAAGAKLLVNAVVYRIEHDANDTIVAIHYLTPEGASFRVTGKIFVLAANAVEIPRLMLMSTSDRHPNGIGNSSGMVGRNLMDHPTTGLNFLSQEPMWPGRGPMRATSINNLRDGPSRSEYAAFKINISNAAPFRAVTDLLIKQGVYGAELDEKIRDWSSRWVSIRSFFEMLPDPQNRIALSPDHKDKLGLPRPEVYYKVSSYVDKATPIAREHYTNIAKLFNGSNLNYNDTYSNDSNHIMGTLIMGNDAQDSVVDGDLRSFDHPNLFIASTGVMPSAGTINSTLTLGALSMRLADLIQAQL